MNAWHILINIQNGGASPSARRRRVQSLGGAVAVEEEQGDGGIDDEPPHEFLCPISMELMTEPVVLLESKQTYDRVSILRWVEERGHKTDPMTRIPLVSRAMEPDRELRAKIEMWRAQRRGWGW